MNSDEITATQTEAQAAPSSPTKEAASSQEEVAATDNVVDDQGAAQAPAQEEPKPQNQDASSSQEPKREVPTGEAANATVRIAKDSQTRKLITFVMSRLENGGTVTLQALNLCVHKAITIALICRDRLGNVYQVNSLLVVQETKEKDAGAEKADDAAAEEKETRTSSGIQIILSKSPLDKTEVGYEKPRPKGFANMTRQKRRIPPNKDDSKVVEKKAPEKVVAEKPKKEPRKSRRDKVKADADADAEAAPVVKEANQQQRRQSRRPRKRAASAERVAQEKKEKEEKEVAEQATATKSRRRQRRSRTKAADEKERSVSEAETARTGGRGNQGRRQQSRREPAPVQQQPKQESRNRSTRGRDDKDTRRASPPDVDYMGREVPRNQNRRSQAPSSQYDRNQQNGRDGVRDGAREGGRSNYQRRGNPYEVGQSYRYMPNFDTDRDTYFSQHYGGPPQARGGGRGGGQGFRGRDQPRPGYFPASRRPQRPDQLVDDFSGYQNQRRY